MKKRLISLLLTVVMLVSLCSGLGASASAEANVEEVTLASGQTVLALCQARGVDFYTYKSLIMNLNGFTSESQFSKLSVGQSVVIPRNADAAAALAGGGASATALAAAGTAPAGTTAAVQTAAGSASGLTTGQASSIPAGDRVAYYLVYYTIQRGETIKSIYDKWGLSYKTYDNQIKKLNNITNYNSIAANKTLLLPTTNPAVANTAYYTVMAHTMRNGESAYDIICSKYGMNYSSNQSMILALNKTNDLSKIWAGSDLYIPISGIVSASSAVSPTTSTVTTTATVSTSANYNLVSQTAVNGSFGLMVDGHVVTTAQAGKTVNVVATPDVGYGIESIKVTKVGDTTSTVAVNNNSFVMPSYSVIVSVTFKQVAAYNITVDSNKNGSVVAMFNGSTVSKGYLGSTISVRAIPKAGFMLDNIRVTYNKYKDSVAVENNQFVMPATDVTVTASFVSDPNYDPSKGNAIFVNANFCNVKTYVGNDEAEFAKKGDLVSVNIAPYENYTVTSVKVFNSDYTKVIASDKNSFTMPDSAVNIVVETKPTVNASFPINIVDPVNGQVSVSVNDMEASSAKVGQVVTVHGFETKPAYNYVTTVYKTNDSTVAVPVEQHEDGTASFIMPDFEVTVRVKFYTYYNVNTHASNGQYGSYGIVWNANPAVQVEKAGAGVELKVGFSYIAPGYSVSEILLIYADGSTYTLDGTTFIMPDCDVTVRVKFAKSTVVRAYSITENDTDKASVYPHWGNTYTVAGKTLNDLKDYYIDVNVAEGSTVTVTPNAGIGYQFDKFVINYKDASGNFQSLTKTYLDKDPTTLKYQFTMPDILAGTVVELRVYFKEVRTYSITPDYTNSCDPANVDLSNADHHMGTYGFITVYDACDHAAEDTKLYIRSNASTGYMSDLSGVKIYKDNKDGTFTDVTADPDVNYDPTNYSFFMPTYDIRIYVPFTSSMFWVKLEKSFDASKGLARGEITLVVNGVHFTEETLTLTGIDKNSTRRVFDPGTQMKIVNTSNVGYILNSKTPFSIYRVDDYGNYISGDVSKSLMLEGSLDTFVLPSFNISIKANYEDEVVAINKAPCEHGSFTVPSQAAWNKPFDITEIYPDEGFELSQILLTYVDFSGTPHKEEPIDISSVSGASKTIQLAGGGKPQSEVTVKVVFTPVRNALEINYEFTGKPSTIADYYNVDLDVLEMGTVEITRDVTTPWEGDARTDTVSKDKGIITGAYVRLGRSYLHYDANFSIAAVTVSNNGFPVDVVEMDGYYYFYMPYVSEGKCVITVKYTNLDEYSFYLSDKATGDAEIKDVTFKVYDGTAWSSSLDVTTAKPGYTIGAVIAGLSAAEPGKTLNVYAVYTDSDGVTHRVKSVKDGDYWTFTVASMPVPPTVAIEYAYEFDAKQITYANADGSFCEFWTDGEQIVPNGEGKLMTAPGKIVTVKPVISTIPEGVVAVGISTDVATTIDGFTFVMPNSDVGVTVNFSKALTVAIDPAVVSELVAKADYAITTGMGTRTNESQFAYNGEDAVFTIMPKSGYVLVDSNIKAYDSDGELTVYPTGNPNEYRLTLRTSNVIINGFDFSKDEMPVNFHYFEDSQYTDCVFSKNGTADIVSGDTVGVNDVILIKNYEGYNIEAIEVKYLTKGDVEGSCNADLTNGTITITSVPASEINIKFKLVSNARKTYEIEKEADIPDAKYADATGLWITSGVDGEGKAVANAAISFVLRVRYDLKYVDKSLVLTYKDANGNPVTKNIDNVYGGSFDSTGMIREYYGMFQMPDAAVKVSFKAKETDKFTVSGTQNVYAVYTDETKSTTMNSGYIGSANTFKVMPLPAAEGYKVKDLTIFYSIFNSEKPTESKEASRTFTISDYDPATDLFTVYVPESSMNNSVRIVVNYEPIA